MPSWVARSSWARNVEDGLPDTSTASGFWSSAASNARCGSSGPVPTSWRTTVQPRSSAPASRPSLVLRVTACGFSVTMMVLPSSGQAASGWSIGIASGGVRYCSTSVSAAELPPPSLLLPPSPPPSSPWLQAVAVGQRDDGEDGGDRVLFGSALCDSFVDGVPAGPGENCRRPSPGCATQQRWPVLRKSGLQGGKLAVSCVIEKGFL